MPRRYRRASGPGNGSSARSGVDSTGDVPGHVGLIGENPLAPLTSRFQWLIDMKVK